MTDTISNLSALLEAIKTGIYTDVEMSGLPNFGGVEPSSTMSVWSWDATHVLVGDGIDDMTIVTRDDWAGRFHDLCDYASGDILGPATERELIDSQSAACDDGGAGVIMVDGAKCYVA